MDISLKSCTSCGGFVIDYTIYKGSEIVGFLCFDAHKWKIKVRDEISMSLSDVFDTWSLLVNRLGLEKV